MITIGALLAEYGITPGQLAATAARAAGFGQAYEMTRNYVLFASDYRSAFPGSTRAQVDLAYRVGKYWYEQGAALSRIDPSQVIPPSFARASSAASETLGLSAPYRYLVRTTFTDPDTGQVRDVHTYVTFDRPVSQDEAFEKAEEQAVALIADTDPFAKEPHEYPSFITDQQLLSFTRYSPGA